MTFPLGRRFSVSFLPRARFAGTANVTNTRRMRLAPHCPSPPAPQPPSRPSLTAPAGSRPLPSTYSRHPNPTTPATQRQIITPNNANRRRWNRKLLQVEHQTVAGGHFCAPPATQNAHWRIPVPQVAKVFAHLQRSSVPPATLLPATGPSSSPLGKVHGMFGEDTPYVWGRSLFGGATFPKGSASQGSPVASQWGRSRH